MSPRGSIRGCSGSSRPLWNLVAIALRRVLASGPLLMALATFMFCIMAAAIKVARAELSALEIIAWRSTISIPLAAVFAWSSGFVVHNGPLLLARAGTGFVAMVCFFTAAKGMALADIALVGHLRPLWVAVLAPLLLGAREKTGPAVWVALGLGLVGSTVLIAPELSVGSRFGLWALIGTVFSALAHTAIRGLGRTEAPRTVVFWFQLSHLPFSVFGYWLWTGELPGVPPLHLLAPILGAGVAATIGQLLMTKAYQQDRATIVAAAAYTGPLWSVALDFTVFGLVPGWTLAIGGPLIMMSAVLLYRRGRD